MIAGLGLAFSEILAAGARPASACCSPPAGCCSSTTRAVTPRRPSRPPACRPGLGGRAVPRPGTRCWPGGWRRHHLDTPSGDGLVPLVRRLCGVHAQLASAAEAAIWLRTGGAVGPADVRRALAEDRTLVKTWALRGTLHLLPAADLPIVGGGARHPQLPPAQSWYDYHGVTAGGHGRARGDRAGGAQRHADDPGASWPPRSPSGPAARSWPSGCGPGGVRCSSRWRRAGSSRSGPRTGGA